MQKKRKRRSVRRGGLPPNRYLTKEQIEQLKSYLDEQVNKAPTSFAKKRAETNRMIIDVAMNSGVRAMDILNLQLQDLPLHHGKPVINIRQGRFEIQRVIDISDALVLRLNKYIRAWRKSAKPKSYLFINEDDGPMSYRSLYSKVTRAGKQSGVGRVTPHMLRHTYATLFYTQHKDIEMLMDQLGHSKPETTAIYAKTASDERRRQANSFDL